MSVLHSPLLLLPRSSLADPAEHLLASVVDEDILEKTGQTKDFCQYNEDKHGIELVTPLRMKTLRISQWNYAGPSLFTFESKSDMETSPCFSSLKLSEPLASDNLQNDRAAQYEEVNAFPTRFWCGASSDPLQEILETFNGRTCMHSVCTLSQI